MLLPSSQQHQRHGHKVKLHQLSERLGRPSVAPRSAGPLACRPRVQLPCASFGLGMCLTSGSRSALRALQRGRTACIPSACVHASANPVFIHHTVNGDAPLASATPTPSFPLCAGGDRVHAGYGRQCPPTPYLGMQKAGVPAAPVATGATATAAAASAAKSAPPCPLERL